MATSLMKLGSSFKCLAVAFGILGIICIALLTANILDANGRFDSLAARSDALDDQSSSQR